MARPEPIRCRRDGCTNRYQPHAAATERELHARARAAGWRIGTRGDGTPDAICPTDARPDPEVAKLCRELAASIQKGQT